MTLPTRFPASGPNFAVARSPLIEKSVPIRLTQTLLFGAASGATMIWPTHREIGYGIIALSLFGLVMLGLHQFFGITTGRIVPFVGMVFCGFGFLAFGSWYFWPRIPEVNARTQEVSAGTAVGITKDFSVPIRLTQRAKQARSQLNPLD